MVAVRVLQIENLRRRRHKNPALPRENARRLQQMIGKDHRIVDHAVAVPIDQIPDATSWLFARLRVERIVQHLGHIDPARLVERDLDRIDHVRFRGDQLRPESLDHVERLKRRGRLGRVGIVGPFLFPSASGESE